MLSESDFYIRVTLLSDANQRIHVEEDVRSGRDVNRLICLQVRANVIIPLH